MATDTFGCAIQAGVSTGGRRGLAGWMLRYSKPHLQHYLCRDRWM